MGFGLFQTPNNVTIVSSAPTHRSGGASGMLGTARLLGQTLGTTLVALLFRMFAEGHRAQACLLLAIFFCHCRRRGKQYPYDTGFSGRKEIKPRQVVEQKHFLSDKNFLLFLSLRAKKKE